MQFENGGNAWFTVVPGTMLIKDGRPQALDKIENGDWAKLLVNQAVIGPGYMLESVKEIRVEGDGHHISAIVKGRLAGYNAVQRKMNIQDAQQLQLNGWTDYRQINQLDISGRDIEYFYDGKPVTLSYLNNYLTRADGDVYIALENNYAGERIKMLSIRTGRDELLKPDTVLSSGINGFEILSNNGMIATDEGTIVRRYGRLVSGAAIQDADYATVSLNGFNKAAVVDIVPAPATGGVEIFRGRVYSIDQGRSFKAQSLETFVGTAGTEDWRNRGWQYAPIQREYTIDNNTLFIEADGSLSNINSFIDYTPDSVLSRENTYAFVADGSRATRVIKMPTMNMHYTSANASRMMPVRGTIYAVEGTTISLKDTFWFNSYDGKWNAVNSAVHGQFYDERTGRYVPYADRPDGNIEVQGNAIIVDRNQVVGANSLRVGQQVQVMCTPWIPNIQSGFTVQGYIVLVEN
jgi:acid stress-induced BolA-like protein IbaG/YrbA